MKKHEICYVKPNMGALKGKKGRMILEEIRNAKRPDRSDLERRARNALNRLMTQ